MTRKSRGIYKVGAARVDFDQLSILCHDHRNRMPPKPMDLLYLLAEEGGTVARDEIIERVWEGNIYVGKRAVNDAIWRLRKALDQDPEQASAIETIPKIGYRLAAPSARIHQQNDHRSSSHTSPWLLRRTTLIALAVSILFAMAVAIAIWPAKNTKTHSVLGALYVTPFTLSAGVEHDAAISQDGRLLAYSFSSSKHSSRILIKSTENHEYLPQELDQGPGFQRFPTFSPDGERLAFVCHQDRIASLTIINRKTGQRQVFKGIGLIPTRRIEWHPKSELIAFSAFDSKLKLAGICLLDVLSKETRFVTSEQVSPYLVDYGVHWSPDGQSISFSRPTKMGSDIFIVNMQGSTRQITNDGVQTWGADWEPDGTSLIISSSRKTTHNLAAMLWRSDLNGEPLSLLGATPQSLYFPEIDPDGDAIFAYTAEPQVNVFLMDLTSSSTMISVTNSSESNSDPDYCPMNGRLVFSSTRNGQKEIWSSTLEGEDVRQLTDLKRDSAFPRWSPDGLEILFIAYNANKTHRTVHILDIASGKFRQLGSDFDFYVCPSWSRDGKWIYATKYENGEFNLWKLSSKDNSSQTVVENGFYAQESVDGKMLYYTKDQENGLFASPTAGGVETRLIPWLGTNGLTWLLGEHRILFLSANADGPEILSYDLTSGRVTPQRSVDPGCWFASRPWSYIPESDRLLFSLNFEDQGEIVQVALDVDP